MEHLFFSGDSRKEEASALRDSVLKTDWDQLQDLIDFLSPKTPWLGFNHNDIPLGSLSEYSIIAGFLTEKLWDGDLEQAHARFDGLPKSEIGHHVASFFQAWLFHGLVESVIKKKVLTSYLVRKDRDGVHYLYTRNLPFCLQAHVVQTRMQPQHSENVNKSMQFDIQHVNKWTSRFLQWSQGTFRQKFETKYPGFMNSLEPIVPAIVRLAEAIEQTRLLQFPKLPTIGALTWQYPDPEGQKRRDKLRGLGWCPFQINLLEDTLNQSTIDWICAWGFRQEPDRHETCSESACARNNIDVRTYQQAHCCQNQGCKKLRPDLNEVVRILTEDMIPVVSLQNINGVSVIRVEGRSRTMAGDYIAISHVWADGIGGATETGLNECQINRVSELCRSYRGNEPGWFWLDALCIPSLTAVGHFVYYEKALVAIRDVYLNAATVLVLDKIVEKCTKKTSTEQLDAHIYLSAWMQRMWTYEEAVLARKLVFVTRDGFHTYTIKTRPQMRRTVCVAWRSLAAQLNRLQIGQNWLNIGHIYRAFRYRLTNASSEEFLSVSGMLNLDTGQLINVKGDERSKRFWILLGDIPDDVPFLTCPKLSESGFRWAPKTMMSPSSTTLDTESNGPIAKCTEDGLLGKYVVFEMDTRLQGTTSEHGSVFNIWVEAKDDSMTEICPEPGLFRIYCVDAWFNLSDSCKFDTIYTSCGRVSLLSPGHW